MQIESGIVELLNKYLTVQQDVATETSLSSCAFPVWASINALFYLLFPRSLMLLNLSASSLLVVIHFI